MKKNLVFRAFVLCSCLMAVAGLATAQGNPTNPTVYRGAELVEVIVPFVFQGDLRDLPRSPEWAPGDAIKEIPRRHHKQATEQAPANPTGIDRDPLLGAQAAAPEGVNLAFSTPVLNFDGQGFAGVQPPDPVGDVGVDYYIQSINNSGGAAVVIYNKSDGSVASGPFQMDSLGSGFCANGLGDPIILYDHLASRWMLSEFSSSGNRLCVYISQTSDPISGGWFNYDFQAPSFPDYPKYGVWPDAYYVSANEANQAAYALERSQMLVGGAASSQRFTAPDQAGFGFQTMTATDLDGPAPPAGAPAYFVRHNDDEVHNAGL